MVGGRWHYHAEQMSNSRHIEAPHSKEFEQAQILYEHLLATGLTPYRAEVNLYSASLQVAGQADLLMRDSSNRIVIVDWKRSKEIHFENNCEIQIPNLQFLLKANSKPVF